MYKIKKKCYIEDYEKDIINFRLIIWNNSSRTGFHNAQMEFFSGKSLCTRGR